MELIELLKTHLDDLERRLQVSDEAMAHLEALYCQIWTEACYDPTDASSQQFATKLLPHIRALNEELKFKK